MEAVKGACTRNELASHFEIHPPQIVQWKQRLLAGVAADFHRGTDRAAAAAAALRDRLYQEIGGIAH